MNEWVNEATSYLGNDRKHYCFSASIAYQMSEGPIRACNLALILNNHEIQEQVLESLGNLQETSFLVYTMRILANILAEGCHDN